MQTIITRHLSLYAMAVFSICTLSSAHAADPNEIDPARFDTSHVEIQDRWAGFYAGVNLDIVAGSAQAATGVGNPKYKSENAIALPGLHLGYNFAPLGNYETGGWMLGVEADLAFGGISERKTDAILGNVKTRSTFNSSARVRAGFAWESLYLYGTAGLAMSDFGLKPVTNKDKEIRIGLTAGLGMEYAFSENWSVRGEVLAQNFGEDKYIFNGTERKVELETTTFRIGLTRKF